MMCFRLALLFVAFSLPLTLPGQARADGLFTPLPLTLEVDYDFEDQSLGPVGIGGAEAGQPVRVGPGLQAEVIEFGTGNQALQISRSTSGGGAVSFGLPGGASIDEGLVRIRFQYTPLGFDNYSIAFGSPTSTGGGFVGIRPRSDGTIRAASSGLTSVPVIGSYTPGETLDFTVDINLDTWTWSAELDGEVVVNNAVFTADSELGRVHFGYWGSGDDRQPMLADDIEILTTEPLVTLLQADFNDKTVDTPLGTGGASVGEPLVINPNLTARIISFDGDDQALNIEKTGATSANTFIDWAFLQDAAISEGHLLVEFDLTPRVGMMHQFRLEATNGGGTSEELLRISTENLGQIRVRFPDDFFGPIVGNYEVDETLKVSIVCNLDDRDCSVALDGAWVVQNRAFAAATSADIAIDRFLSGVSGLSDLGGDYDLNNLRIRASRAPGIAAEMAFIDQPVDIQCGDGQPLNVQVSAGDGGPAADMIDVFLRPDHPEITQDDMAGFSTFTWEGVAEFPSLAVVKRGNSLRLVAEIDDPFNPVSVTSEPFNILAGTPSSSSYLEEPGDGFVGQTFDPPVRLQILDNCGENSVAGREITLYVLNGPAGATLSGETATTNADGEVVFPDFSIDQPGTYRIAARFDDVVISSSSSPFFTIEATPPAAAVFQVQPSTVIVTQTMTPAVEVTVENTLELPVPDGTEVSLALVDPGSATLTGATATTTDGVAIFDALQIDQPGSYQLRASVPDLPADNEPVSALFDVTPGPVAVLSFETQPTSVDAGAAISPAVTVAVTDINGFAVVDGTTVALSLASGPAEGELLGTLEQGTIDGMATFPGLSLQVTGTYTLQASVEGLQVTSSEFQITASTIHVLAYLTPPSDGTVNQPLSPPVVVEARDQYGNLITAERTISLSRFEFPEGGFHSGDSATSIDGIATFDSVTMTKPGTWRLRANSTGVPIANRPVSDPFEISPGPPAALSFAQQPTSTTAGTSINPAVTVAVTDADGFPVLDGTTVTLALASGPAAGELIGTLEQETVDGFASFPDLSVQIAGTYSLQANIGALEEISSAFQINPAGTHLLTYLNPPGDGTVNQILTPAITVEARDEFGNLVADGRTIALSIAEGPSESSLSGTFADTVDGIASFSEVVLNRPGTYRLRAIASGVAGENRPVSEPFEISPGPPNAATFEQQPTTAVIDEALNPAVSVRVVDGDGFDVADGTLVEITLASGPAGAVLSGTTTRPTSDGLAVFDDLALDLAGEYTLQASVDGTAITATSTAFNVLDTGPASASFLSQPGDTPVGEVMAPPVAVEVLDGEGGPVADGTAVVLVLVEPGEATLSGSIANTIDGVALFEALSVSRPGHYQLRAEVSGLEPSAQPISETFEVLPGPAASIIIEQQPTTTFAGQIITPPVTIRLLDEFGTPVSDGQMISLTGVSGPPGAEATGTITRTTVDGVAVFDDLVLEQPDSEYSLTFSHAELSVTSDDFAVLADRIFNDRFEAEE